jgi:thioesterase CepJ
MPQVELTDVTISYDVFGTGDPVVLVCGCGQPAVGWHVRRAAFIGSCNRATAWEKAITTVERDIARLDPDLPPLFYATETLRYLPNTALQDDSVVDGWLSLIGDLEPWPNPGRLGQYEACLAWSTDATRVNGWPTIAVPCLVLAFEHDVDSPPARARDAASEIPGARFVEIAGASHLGVFTHGAEVSSTLVDFFLKQEHGQP